MANTSNATVVCRANCGTPQERRRIAANLATWERAQARRRARQGDRIVRKVRNGRKPSGLTHRAFAEAL
jgi:hypothetical protein